MPWRIELQPPRTFAIVVPTIGRPSLRRLLLTMTAELDRLAAEVILVDDRAKPASPLPADLDSTHSLQITVIRTGGRGPAAARNAGWRAATADWIVFLDDDVVLPVGWGERLDADIAACDDDVGGCQGQVQVPLPAHRRPTGWERNTAGLVGAKWITADMAYRRVVLAQTGGFDERFPRAYREDSELALRVLRRGWKLIPGERTVIHPVRPADDWALLRVEIGNADDALMDYLYGSRWRNAVEAPRGGFWLHVVTAASAAMALGGLVTKSPSAMFGVAFWCLLTGRLIVRKLAAGPGLRDAEGRRELIRVLKTAPLIPLAAVSYRVYGEFRARRIARAGRPGGKRANLSPRRLLR
ncbi:glycosyltransferase family 2 protein [Nonomuraea insulae]|uniref:Glycosyltransferase family 2 protein n=1 Tax=Nonomuraea insulae TaxID=1616787 RepID=A0ABW1D8F5_9ACTN